VSNRSLRLTGPRRKAKDLLEILLTDPGEVLTSDLPIDADCDRGLVCFATPIGTPPRLLLYRACALKLTDHVRMRLPLFPFFGRSVPLPCPGSGQFSLRRRTRSTFAMPAPTKVRDAFHVHPHSGMHRPPDERRCGCVDSARGPLLLAGVRNRTARRRGGYLADPYVQNWRPAAPDCLGVTDMAHLRFATSVAGTFSVVRWRLGLSAEATRNCTCQLGAALTAERLWLSAGGRTVISIVMQCSCRLRHPGKRNAVAEVQSACRVGMRQLERMAFADMKTAAANVVNAKMSFSLLGFVWRVR